MLNEVKNKGRHKVTHSTVICPELNAFEIKTKPFSSYSLEKKL